MLLLLLLNPIIKRDEAIETMIAYLSSGIAPLLWAWNRLMLMQTRVLGAIDSLAAWAIFSPLSLSFVRLSAQCAAYRRGDDGCPTNFHPLSPSHGNL